MIGHPRPVPHRRIELDPEVADPGFDDLYSTGTEMTIGRMLRMPDGTIAVNPVLVGVVSVIVIGLSWVIGTRAIEAINRPISTNLDRLVGKVGQARSRIYSEGSVYVGGEVWTARSQVEIPVGSKVRVVSREGLVLTVEPVTSAPAQE